MPEAYPLLMGYCRAAVTAKHIAAELDEFKPEWAREDGGLRRWNKLLAMQDREERLLASLGGKLRLTPASQLSASNAGTIARRGPKLKPWQE
jgi:hypothetical protein